MVTTSGRRQEFSIRGLIALTEQINNDPSVVETDWREAFLAAFDFTESQRQFLNDYPAEHNQRVQELFRLAASQARIGRRMKLRIVSDLTGDNRRILQLEVPTVGLAELDRTIINETGSPDAALTWPIVCCCADCCCWHWCDPSVNPCA